MTEQKKIPCAECGSENIIEGSFTSRYGVFFCEKGTENKLRPNAYKIEGYACLDCGTIFGLRVKLKKNKGK